MLDKVKKALRRKNNTFDDEIKDIIFAALADLQGVGIIVPKWTDTAGEIPAVNDPLLTRAIILYAKANFGYSDDQEKYQKAYDDLKRALSLAGDYIALE